MISIDQIKNYTKFMTCAELDELRRYFNSAEFNKIYFKFIKSRRNESKL
jgi:ssDNA-specific exonuclease RecJ